MAEKVRKSIASELCEIILKHTDTRHKYDIQVKGLICREFKDVQWPGMERLLKSWERRREFLLRLTSMEHYAQDY